MIEESRENLDVDPYVLILQDRTGSLILSTKPTGSYVFLELLILRQDIRMSLIVDVTMLSSTSSCSLYVVASITSVIAESCVSVDSRV